VLLVVVVVVAVAVIACSSGTYVTYPRHALLGHERQARAPQWTRPCWHHATDEGDPLCVHVKGRIVWIQRHDPDGDGDRHFIVMARLHPRIVKIERAFPLAHLPRIGSSIDAVGYLSRGGSGHDEVETIRLTATGWR
jgi:hypothetical protein